MAKKPPVSASNRSKVSNGTVLHLPGFAEVDGRSAIARRFRDHVDALTSQVGGDPSPAQDMLIRRCATLAVLCESDEAKVAAGEAIDEETYLRRITVLSGVLGKLGLARKAKDITPHHDFDAHAAAVLEADQ
jgi:hypothetical protein